MSAGLEATNFQDYIKYAHTLAYYTLKMEYDVILGVKGEHENPAEIPTSRDLADYFKGLILECFSTSLVRHKRLVKGYDLFDNSIVRTHRRGSLELEETMSEIIQNVGNIGGNSFILRIDSYYKSDIPYQNVILDFYNIFANEYIDEKFIVNAVFFNIDSMDGISVIVKEIPESRRNNSDKYWEELNETHKRRVNEAL
jgi:hypothetical protein